MMSAAWATMAAYLLFALTTWSPEIPQKRLEPIADDIARVMQDIDGIDEDDAFPPTLMAAIGMEESGWQTWILDGSCNRRAWRDAHKDFLLRYGGGPHGPCDGGRSFGPWQAMRPSMDDPFGWAMIRDRDTAIREGWRIADASMRARVGLCAYTGERYPVCPAADRRWNRAQSWVNTHPYVPETD